MPALVSILTLGGLDGVMFPLPLPTLSPPLGATGGRDHNRCTDGAGGYVVLEEAKRVRIRDFGSSCTST